MAETLPKASKALERRTAWRQLSIRKRRDAMRAARDVYRPGMTEKQFSEAMEFRLGFGWEALIPIALELFKIIAAWWKSRNSE